MRVHAGTDTLSRTGNVCSAVHSMLYRALPGMCSSHVGCTMTRRVSHVTIQANLSTFQNGIWIPVTQGRPAPDARGGALMGMWQRKGQGLLNQRECGRASRAGRGVC